jgi:serine/threonine protein kinase
LKNLKDKRPKILETNTGNIIKIFYARKKWFSAWKNRRSAIKFCRNAVRLEAKGISAPKITSLFNCPSLGIYVVEYKKIPGENLRVMTRRGDSHILAEFAAFIAKLHQKGIFFRSLHLENLLYQSSGQFALVDIVDVRFKNKPLNVFLRYRNLKHMFHIHQDRKAWKMFGHLNYMQNYYQFVSLSHLSKMLILLLIRQRVGKNFT